MDQDLIDDMLAAIPGARRAARGLIIPAPGGGELHVRSVIKDVKGLAGDEMNLLEICSVKEVIRLRELSGAHDYLLRLRVKEIMKSPRAVRVMLDRRTRFEAGRKPWALSHYYHSRDHHHKSYIDLMARANAKKLKGIPAGLAFIHEANALCIRSMAGDVIVASESLEHFYYFMTIAFYGDQLGIEPIDRADALLIAIRLMKGNEALDFDLDPRGTLPAEVERELSALVKGQMQFTFGHEFAHLIRGHLSPPDAAADTACASTDAEYLSGLRTYNHELEFEADLYALLHVAHNREAFPEIARGAFLVLLYLHFLQKAAETAGTGKMSVSNTHPSPEQRIRRLHQGLGKKSPLDDEGLAGLFAASGMMEQLLASRMQGQRPDLLTFYGSVYLSSYVSRPRRDRIDY